MQTVEHYKRKISNAEDLHAIVHTMKVLSSVSIHQFEEAAESLGEYYRTVKMGLQIVLGTSQEQHFPYLYAHKVAQECIIILGSSQGLCGTFDEQAKDFLEAQVLEQSFSAPRLLVMGGRLASKLSVKYSVEDVIELPASVSGLNNRAVQLLKAIEHLRETKHISRVVIIHHKPVKKGLYKPRIQFLLPLDRHWLDRLAAKKWPTNNLPKFTIDAEQLFTHFIRQYLLVSLYRAMAESLAAEHTSRLNAMSIAEDKIEERLSKLHNKYAQERQKGITEELLDILSGYLAVKDREGK
ncbi:F0F1 ATP synthase subunit gamma [Fodinibius halophilus]|uniref:F0F1 ATP synthase subunit gamma n=1 Tax=Fodinibius halophilus TaxID=1736908 RepID=A0A6M1TBZ3_9BACT|nr:F0F1 ATP synthase subunit gamma [Fodinibius halophilus]NGP89873.1 F0F1 ATP synthase subunit gamma [Fodinibius halophilus]